MTPEELRQEEEANEFAGQLLVPPAMLRKELLKLGGIDLAGDGEDVRKLARKFGVTPALIVYRIAQDRHIDPSLTGTPAYSNGTVSLE